MTLVLMCSQLMTSAKQLTDMIKETAQEWFTTQVNSKINSNDADERQILERKYARELSHIEEELREVESKLRIFFMTKLEKNLQRVQDSKRITSVTQFCEFQQLMDVIANGLKTHFQFKTMSFVGILEDQ